MVPSEQMVTVEASQSRDRSVIVVCCCWKMGNGIEAIEEPAAKRQKARSQ